MAIIVKSLLVAVCLLNMNLLCVQAFSLTQPQGQQEENKKSETDYTIEITDAKVLTFSPEYFSKKTTLYTTMYNESFSVLNGVVDLVSPPPPDVQLKVDLFEFDSITNMWIQKASPVPYIHVCNFIKNNAEMLKKFTDLKDKECPISPGVIAINNVRIDTDNYPQHVPEARYRANTQLNIQNTQETILSLVVYAEIITKPGMED